MLHDGGRFQGSMFGGTNYRKSIAHCFFPLPACVAPKGTIDTTAGQENVPRDEGIRHSKL